MKYVIANLKSHKTTQEVSSWLSVLQSAHSSKGDLAIIVALPFPYLHLFTHNSHHMIHNSSILLAAQDVSPFPPGSYTGAVNAAQLKDMGVKYCIVGHSERRKYFHETSLEISNKVKELLSVGITPILCLGRDDIQSQFATLEVEQLRSCLFAYETLSDIGGTETTPTSDIKDTISLITSLTSNEHKGIIYGGSVTPDNVDSVIGLVDGVLVATASLEPTSFVSIIQKVSQYV